MSEEMKKPVNPEMKRFNSPEAKKIFNKPISYNESGVLSKLWRNIIIDNNLLGALDYIVQQYVDRSHNAKEKKSIKLKNKSTLTANITAPEMTFKTFLDLIFNLLKVKKMTITVKLTFPNGDETLNTISVDKSVADDGGHDDESNDTNTQTSERKEGSSNPSD